jgi:hypothetical protein
MSPRCFAAIVACAIGSSLACGPRAPASPVTPAPARASDVASKCESLDLLIAAEALRVPGHPCRDWIDATRGRMFGTGVAASGTVVATTAARGGGLFLTCKHCGAGGDQLLTDPEIDPPPVLEVREPQGFYFAYRLFGPIPPSTAFDDKGKLTKISPRDDFIVATISNQHYRSSGAYPLAPRQVKDGAIPLSDPRGISASAKPWIAAQPGAQALLLGFPRNLPDRDFHGELVFSVGKVLDDATARDKLARAEPDEASTPYDPEAEFVVAARAVSGMSGGGVFDVDGRFLGVMVRGTVNRVDGVYLTRVVRAAFIRTQLASAIAGADAALRDHITPFLPEL